MIGQGGRGQRPCALLAALLISGSTALAPIFPASAQTAPAPSAPAAPAPASSPCELDIWPAATTHTTFQGWLRAGAVDGARRGMKGYPDMHAGLLDTAQQARLIATIDWRGILGDPALAVVIHPAAPDPGDDRGRTARLVADRPACYSELIITSSIVESAVFSTKSVRIQALRKRFDGAGSAPVNFSSMSQGIIRFSDEDKAAKDADQRWDAAVQAAFVDAVTKFGVMQSFH